MQKNENKIGFSSDAQFMSNTIAAIRLVYEYYHANIRDC